MTGQLEIICQKILFLTLVGNEIYTRLDTLSYSQGRVIMINDCVLQQSAIMTNVWLWVFDSITFWVTSITMQSLGSLQLLLTSHQIYPLPLPSSVFSFFHKKVKQYISWASGPSEKVMRGPRPSDFFLFIAYHVPRKTLLM